MIALASDPEAIAVQRSKFETLEAEPTSTVQRPIGPADLNISLQGSRGIQILSGGDDGPQRFQVEPIQPRSKPEARAIPMPLCIEPQHPFCVEPAKFRCGTEKSLPEPHCAPTAEFKGLLLRTETEQCRIGQPVLHAKSRQGAVAAQGPKGPVPTSLIGLQLTTQPVHRDLQNRLQTPKTRQGSKAHLQPRQAQLRTIRRRRQDSTRPDGDPQAQGAKSFVRAKIHVVAQRTRQRALQAGARPAQDAFGSAVKGDQACCSSPDQNKTSRNQPGPAPRFPHQTRRSPRNLAQYKETVFSPPDPMAFDQLLLTAAPWLGWSGLGLGALTAVAFLTKWGIRFRLVGVSSFTLLLAVSCWAFGVSYTPPVVVEGAVRAPIVFDNGNDLVVAQVPADLAPTTVQATLEQLEGNLRGSGRSSSTVLVRLRGIQPEGDGLGRPVILGEVSKTLR